MTVISEPRLELVGEGKNIKYVKECVELHLGQKDIEKIRGFEDFYNLQSLWLNGNKLKKINNLDTNFRLRELHVQDNEICTLRGSLPNFTFLEHLDLSNNRLRNLDKQIQILDKFKFLSHLNLKGNPLCEEPEYRLIVIHRIISLKVLDQHVVTAAERMKARGVIGGDVATLTLAFGQRRVPVPPGLSLPPGGERRSTLERELVKEATEVRETLRLEAYAKECETFAHDPYPPPPGDAEGRMTIPPSAGAVKAQQEWQRLQEVERQLQLSTQTQGGRRATTSSAPAVFPDDDGRGRGTLLPSAFSRVLGRPREDIDLLFTTAADLLGDDAATTSAHPPPPSSMNRDPRNTMSMTMTNAAARRSGGEEYVPRDILILHSQKSPLDDERSRRLAGGDTGTLGGDELRPGASTTAAMAQASRRTAGPSGMSSLDIASVKARNGMPNSVRGVSSPATRGAAVDEFPPPPSGAKDSLDTFRSLTAQQQHQQHQRQQQRQRTPPRPPGSPGAAEAAAADGKGAPQQPQHLAVAARRSVGQGPWRLVKTAVAL